MTDMNEIFSRDPMGLTKDDIREVIEWHRNQRHLFKNNPGAVAPKKKAAPKLTEGQQAASKLNLDFKL